LRSWTKREVLDALFAAELEDNIKKGWEKV